MYCPLQPPSIFVNNMPVCKQTQTAVAQLRDSVDAKEAWEAMTTLLFRGRLGASVGFGGQSANILFRHMTAKRNRDQVKATDDSVVPEWCRAMSWCKECVQKQSVAEPDLSVASPARSLAEDAKELASSTSLYCTKCASARVALGLYDALCGPLPTDKHSSDANYIRTTVSAVINAKSFDIRSSDDDEDDEDGKDPREQTDRKESSSVIVAPPSLRPSVGPWLSQRDARLRKTAKLLPFASFVPSASSLLLTWRSTMCYIMMVHWQRFRLYGGVIPDTDMRFPALNSIDKACYDTTAVDDATLLCDVDECPKCRVARGLVDQAAVMMSDREFSQSKMTVVSVAFSIAHPDLLSSHGSDMSTGLLRDSVSIRELGLDNVNETAQRAQHEQETRAQRKQKQKQVPRQPSSAALASVSSMRTLDRRPSDVSAQSAAATALSTSFLSHLAMPVASSRAVSLTGVDLGFSTSQKQPQIVIAPPEPEFVAMTNTDFLALQTSQTALSNWKMLALLDTKKRKLGQMATAAVASGRPTKLARGSEVHDSKQGIPVESSDYMYALTVVKQLLAKTSYKDLQKAILAKKKEDPRLARLDPTWFQKAKTQAVKDETEEFVTSPKFITPFMARSLANKKIVSDGMKAAVSTDDTKNIAGLFGSLSSAEYVLRAFAALALYKWALRSHSITTIPVPITRETAFIEHLWAKAGGNNHERPTGLSLSEFKQFLCVGQLVHQHPMFLFMDTEQGARPIAWIEERSGITEVGIAEILHAQMTKNRRDYYLKWIKPLREYATVYDDIKEKRSYKIHEIGDKIDLDKWDREFASSKDIQQESQPSKGAVVSAPVATVDVSPKRAYDAMAYPEKPAQKAVLC